jgi:hypothetical protein
MRHIFEQPIAASATWSTPASRSVRPPPATVEPAEAGVLIEIKEGRDKLFLNRRLALLTGPGE